MNGFNRKTLLAALAFLLVFGFSGTAFSAFLGQRVIVPYATVSGDYWVGLVVLNHTSDDQFFQIVVYADDGDKIGSSCFFLESGEQKVNVLENYISQNIKGRCWILVRTGGAETEQFSVTMFMGNTSTANKGFGITTFRSEDYGFGSQPCLI